MTAKRTADSATAGLVLAVALTGPWGVSWSEDRPALRLADIAADAGLSFRFETGSRGRFDLPEILGGGVAVFDADQDGWLDLYLCNGGPIVPAAGLDDPPCRLFLNRGDGRFADATDRAGAPGPRYAMGAAVGDVDGDGRIDLFVTGWGEQRLYRSLGGGVFADITEIAGLTSSRWSTSAAFADLDLDGDLDLYVCNYVQFDANRAPFCAAPDGRRDYCGPLDLPAEPDRLYRNNGDGTFTDISIEAGIVDRDGRGLGVVIADLTGDPLPDLYVANDATPGYLFENRGGLRFREVGAQAGVALDGRGEPPSAMGAAVGDLDGDGRIDLAVTNFLNRGTLAFRSLGGGLFQETSAALGLAAATRDVLGFGIALIDLDGDGRADLVQANGHVLSRERLGEPLAMRPSLLRGGETFVIPDTRSENSNRLINNWLNNAVIGRGVAIGDYDGDGRPDVVLTALDAAPRLLRNQSEGRWIVLELAAKPPAHPSAVGAEVRAWVNGRPQVQAVVGGGSYLSASDTRLFVGLGDADEIDRLEVRWPSGQVDRWRGLRPRGTRPWRLLEGTGTAFKP